MRKVWLLGAVIGILLLLGFGFGKVLSDHTEKQVQAGAMPLLKPTRTLKIDPDLQVLTSDFKIYKVEDKDDYYHIDKPISLLPKDSPLDKYGVTMFEKEGKQFNHPVRLAQHTMLFINSYKLTKDQAYLEKAKLYAQRLYDISEKENNELYFPYLFDVKELKAPWYSGMAQGQALGAFTRLYEVTTDKKYLDWATRTYNSLKRVKKSQKNWVTLIDNKKYIWFEEYPAEEATHVLNGYLFSIIGLHDYYHVTKDPSVKQYLQASLTTVYDHLHMYRVPNESSVYGIGLPQSPDYHFVHIRQLDILYKMTKEKYFLEVKEVFEADFDKVKFEKWQKEKAKPKTMWQRIKQKVKNVLT